MNRLEKFTQPYPLNTAVLFLVFNRLDTTKKVFEAIRKAKPPRLYIAADGARKDKQGEAKAIQAVRDYIISSIDWDCKVETLFRDKNLGCKYAVSSAIDWFFEQESMGIVLEDDCLPSQSFFWFCEELLERYKDDMRIWHISGDNFQRGVKRGAGDYYLSKYSHIWGWASWKSRWKHYDVEMESFDSFMDEDQIRNVFKNKAVRRYWNSTFCHVSKDLDTWDYQWVYTVLSNSGLSVLPNENLVSNIGFGLEATHTKSLESEYSKLSKNELSFPLKHPLFMLQNIDADSFTESKMFSQNALSGYLKRILRFL